MSYQNAADVLPQELIERIQAYVDGGYLYVPRKTGCRRAWGQKDGRKQETRARNREIYRRSLAGETAGPRAFRKLLRAAGQNRRRNKNQRAGNAPFGRPGALFFGFSGAFFFLKRESGCIRREAPLYWKMYQGRARRPFF